MKSFRSRFVVLALLSQGLLLADTCTQVLDTIFTALNIVGIWV
jgi:hypothetical protein